MSLVFIIGFMTAGKTREGKRLAKLMNKKFIDLDRYIEEREKKTVVQIFNEKGEENFRKIESEVLKSIDANENLIVSCGGGTPCFHRNMNWMNDNGIVIWLKVSTKTVLKRVAESKKQRPLLKTLEGNDLVNFINQKMIEREPFYSQAHIQMNTEHLSLEKLVEEINRVEFTKN